MSEEEDRWIPTSQDVTGSADQSDSQAPPAKTRSRLLRRLTFRRKAGADRTEVAAPSPAKTGGRQEDSVATTTPAGAAGHDGVSVTSVDHQSEIQAPEKKEESDDRDETDALSVPQTPDSSRRSRGRGRFVTPRRLADTKEAGTEEPSTTSSDPEWWPKSATLRRALVTAEEKGHSISGVETLSNGTQIWRCDNCGRALKREFEQALQWPEGVGTWALKMDVAGFSCR